MRGLVQTGAALFFLAGIALMVWGAITALGVNLSGASAVQVSQVYTQGLLWVALGIGTELCAAVLLLSLGEGGETSVVQSPAQQTKDWPPKNLVP